MPSFPRYNSKAQLTTQQPSFQAPEDTSAQVTNEIAGAVETAVDVTSKWAQAIQSTRESVATVNLKSDLVAIQQDASVDSDPNNEPLYRERIKTALSKHSQGLPPEMVNKLAFDAQVNDIQLQNTFRKKWLEVDSLALDRAIDLQISNPTNQSMDVIRQELDKRVATGHISETMAYEKLKKANDALGKNRINKDLYQAQTPDEVDAITQAITSGAYEQGGVIIQPDDKKTFLDIADRVKNNVEKKIKAQQAEAQTKNRVDVISGVASGELDPTTMDISSVAEYDPALGLALTKVKDYMINYNPKKPLEDQPVSMAGVITTESEMTKARNYVNSVSNVFMQNDNERLGEFVLRELERQGDGKNSSVKLAAFMRLAAMKVKANNPQTPEDSQAVDWLKAINGGIAFLKESNPYLAPLAIGEFIVKNYFSKANTSDWVMEEAKSALANKVIERYNSVSKLPGIPNKIVDGEAGVEDLHSGLNELDGETYSGDYGDQSRSY